MSAVVGSLRVNLGLNSAEFNSGLGKANKSMNRFARRAGKAMGAATAAFATGLAVMTKHSLSTIDEQAKLAQSLMTTTASIQVMARAGELAGVSFSGVEQASKDLHRRLSQAATGAGPLTGALSALGMSASELMEMPLDERVSAINTAISEFIPAAGQAAYAAKFFGEEGSIAMSRIDASVISAATDDLERFGVAVSDVDAKQIERTNDAISRIKLVSTGLGNQLAVVLAPTLERIADGFASISEVGGPLNTAFHAVFDNLGRLVAIAATAAAMFGGKLVIGLALAAVRGLTLAKAFVVLRFAIIRTGIGVLIVGAGELVYQFARLVKATGGFSNAMGMIKDVGVEVWDRIGMTVLSYQLRFEVMTRNIKAWWLDALRFMGNKWAELVEKIAPTFNKITDSLGLDTSIETIGIRNWASAMEHAAITQRRLGETAKGAAIDLESFAGRPLQSIEAIRAAFAGSAEEIAQDWGVEVPAAITDGTQAGAAAAQEAASDMNNSIVSAIGSWSDAFAEWAVDGFKDFKGFASSVMDTFKNMLVQMIAMAVNNKIMIGLGFGGSGVGSMASAATSGSGMLGGIGSAFMGSFGAAGAAGTGLLGGLGAVGAGVSGGFAAGGIGGAISGGFAATGTGISAGLAAGGMAGIGAAVGAALPIIGIGLALFSLFKKKKKKPPISKEDFAKIQSGLQLTGVELLSTGKAGQKAAAHLKKLAGGMEEFAKNTQFYFDNFFTDSEKRDRSMSALTDTFAKLQIQMPTTAKGFRDIVESLDLTSKQGRIAYDSLLKVAPVFTSVFGSIADAGAALSAQFGEDVFSTKEQMNRTMAALNRGATVGVLPSGSGVIHPSDVLTVTERMDQLQSETAVATMSSAGTLAQIRDLFRAWDFDGMPEVRTP